MKSKVLFGALLLFCTTLMLAQNRSRAAIAYLDKTSIVIADSSGVAIRSVPTHFRKPISQIAVDATGTKLIATVKTFGRGEFGGDFYFWSLQTKQWKRITFGPYVYKETTKGHREVYDEPAFSPDGRHVAFAIHTESLYDDNDVVMASGPAALLDLRSRQVRIIRSTLGDPQHDPTGPPWFANSPHWSEDGKQLLLSFENGFATIALATDKLRLFSPETKEGSDTYGVNWLDSNQVVFLSFFQEQSRAPVSHSLDLRDEKIFETPERFKSLPGRLLAFNSDVSVVKVSGTHEVHGPTVWKLPQPGVFGSVPTF